MASEKDARRLTPRGRDRRRQLMGVAARLFAENGFHPTSVAEIVAGVGVGKGSFYWYFDSKDQLFVEILHEAQQDLRRAQQHAIESTGDPLERIALGTRASMHWFAANRHLMNLFQFAATEEAFAPALRRGQEVALADAVKHVKDGVVAGVIRDTEPEVLAHAVLGVITHLARELIQLRNEDPDSVADAAIAFCLDGLRG
jgi:TetR/AcrR family transcriptional regulator, cholesterol catabolism regulator